CFDTGKTPPALSASIETFTKTADFIPKPMSGKYKTAETVNGTNAATKAYSGWTDALHEYRLQPI
ncbi:hypothetical protein VU02_04725, partial [Desulfobulbus sp. N2]|nr:hypothetical protein [Desulfobulbus sp. N2]